MNQLTPPELKQWIATGKDFLLIDIRDDWERENYNIGGLHIPMGELFSRHAELPAGKEVVLYCEKGIRSVIAIQRLEATGFNNLYNLAGGMKAWKEAL
jgi:adenylyltransferase/sulfurtransferase